MFLVRSSRQRIARFGETVPGQQRSKTFFLELRRSAGLSVNVPNVRTLLEWELVTRNANKPVVVELQKLRGSAQNRGTPDTEVNIFSLNCLCLVPSFRENGLVLRQLQR